MGIRLPWLELANSIATRRSQGKGISPFMMGHDCEARLYFNVVFPVRILVASADGSTVEPFQPRSDAAASRALLSFRDDYGGTLRVITFLPQRGARDTSSYLNFDRKSSSTSVFSSCTNCVIYSF